MLLAGALVLAAAASPAPRAGSAEARVEQAEAQGAAALVQAAADPEAALRQAREALELTVEFDPTAFVAAGRKGEVVEDAYQAARNAYRRHRGRLYEAVGECHARAGRPLEAVRYLRRAVLLERRKEPLLRLSRSLVALGRGREALDLLLAEGGELGAAELALAGQAADAARIPSLQAEVDRARLRALRLAPPAKPLDGPLGAGERARLSTGAPFRIGEAPVVLYVAEPSCRTCSADLDALRRALPAGLLPLMLPISPDHDDVLRRAMVAYRVDWPVLMGSSLPGAEVSAPALLVLARGGWSAAVLAPAAAAALPRVLDILGRADVAEPRPRSAWNRRPVDRSPAAAGAAGLLPEGLVAGEDEPAPEAFRRAVEAFRERRPAAALELFVGLEAKGDGWLLPPEARLDRARCLAALGRREEARRLLLRTGDSRVQDAVDAALQEVANPGPSGRRPH